MPVVVPRAGGLAAVACGAPRRLQHHRGKGV